MSDDLKKNNNNELVWQEIVDELKAAGNPDPGRGGGRGEKPDAWIPEDAGEAPENRNLEDTAIFREVPIEPKREPDARGIGNSAPSKDFFEYAALFEDDEEENGEKPPRGRKKKKYAEKDAPLIRCGADEEPEDPRDYRPIRQSRDGRLGCLGGVMYFVFVVSVSIILACLAWMAATDVLAFNKEERSATITLPESAFREREVEIKDENGKVTGKKKVKVADIDYVAKALEDAGIISYDSLFRLYARISSAAYKIDPGTYTLSTMLDYRALVSTMTVGSEAMLVTTVTIPEGYSMDQIFFKLEENGICSAEDLYAAASNYRFEYTFLGGVQQGDPYRLEGFLFPDTYDFYQGEQASSVINKFLSNMNEKITADMYKQAENLGLTMREAVVVASMIEKEAGVNDERAAIASVIYNRLNAGMPLQIDATVQYALSHDYSVQLTAGDFSCESPYNTYMFAGFPAGAISNPGLPSINAALQPDYTDYYYYALDVEAGSHRFFRTYGEANAFAQTQDYG